MAEVLGARRSQIFALVRQTLRSASYRPPLLPTAAIKLWELARNSEAPLSKVKELVEQEPLIAGEVLRIAQSAIYSRGQPVETLSDAVLRLGAVELSQIFLDVATRSTVFKSERFGPWMTDLSKHSTCTANIARYICEFVGLPADRAFIGGLLHDAGIAGTLLVLETVLADNEDVDIAGLIPEIHAVHQDASTVLATRWNLPMTTRWVIGHHHNFKASGHVNPLAAVICLAEWLATEAGAAAPEVVSAESAAEVITYFRISETNVERLKARALSIVTQGVS